MGHMLTLDLPDQVYETLSERAKQSGKTLEDLVLEWLTHTTRNLTDDPLLQLAGTFESSLTDVSDRHDDYIGQGLQEELRRSNHG